MRLTNFGHCVQISFFPNVFPVNCYLVKEDDGVTLIDAALPSSAKGIQEAAHRLGLPITRILLTHAHADHVGSLDQLHALLKPAEVRISERDRRLLSGDVTLEDDEPQVKIRGGIKPCETKPTGSLKEGDRIGHLEVVPCPGHTPGHVAFLDVRDKTLIAGDAYQIHGGMAVSGVMKPLFPFPALATWHQATALESAKRLYDLRPSVLAVGHGKVLADPLDAMQHAIQVAQRRLTESRRKEAL